MRLRRAPTQPSLLALTEITIPVGRPVTFAALRQLNSGANTEQLAAAFMHLPLEMREQAWQHLGLKLALDEWNDECRPYEERNQDEHQ